jgi:hypothetical protein
VRNALMKWTNRVIDYKLRELNVVQRNETILLTYVIRLAVRDLIFTLWFSDPPS